MSPISAPALERLDNKVPLSFYPFPGISLTAGGGLKNRLLRVLSRLLFQEIEESEKGTRLPSRLLLHPSRLLQNLTRTLLFMQVLEKTNA